MTDPDKQRFYSILTNILLSLEFIAIRWDMSGYEAAFDVRVSTETNNSLDSFISSPPKKVGIIDVR